MSGGDAPSYITERDGETGKTLAQVAVSEAASTYTIVGPAKRLFDINIPKGMTASVVLSRQDTDTTGTAVTLTYNDQVGGAEEWLPTLPIPQGAKLIVLYNGATLPYEPGDGRGFFTRNPDGDMAAFNVWPPYDMQPIGPAATMFVVVTSPA